MTLKMKDDMVIIIIIKIMMIINLIYIAQFDINVSPQHCT